MDSFVHSLYQAIEHASPIWQQAIHRLSWSHGLVASAYGAAAWLCFLNVQAEKEAQGSCALCWAATVLLCLLGANVVLQADVFVTQTLRTMARLQDWYGQRRVLQYVVIGLMALAALLALNSRIWLSQRFRPNAQTHTGAVSAGLLALLMLFAVRLVSAHGTDAVLDVRLLGVSIGRLFELACLACVMWGALCSLRWPFANPKPYPQGIDHHV
ncbi:MAG: hypothetical protein BWK72_18595 [Rhodoferax ferrireducens]|uniref:Transmembrane protein n=1 Tax=Rhodoferax ferrireducens TaxID=192843 RepID=A0A1W9KPS4_9BURK|nr:MAG: hypothetical protein BWK72_18595 [Rhodoferax ferrireducens]